MSKLLSYFKALLTQFVNRSETEFVSTQSKAGDAFTEFTYPTDGTWSYGVTAPKNGRFVMYSTHAYCLYLSVSSTENTLLSTIKITANRERLSVYVPVKKGQTVTAYSLGATEAETCWLRFIPDVGAQ